MTTIAIVGAGPGLGAAVARRFGAEGFDIALISRQQERVDALAADLTSAGLTARGYAASVREPDVLTSALQRAADDLGTIEVLQYSPLPQREFLRAVLETTIADLTGAVEFSIYGPVTAMQQVLPGMRELGRGTPPTTRPTVPTSPVLSRLVPPSTSVPTRCERRFGFTLKACVKLGSPFLCRPVGV